MSKTCAVVVTYNRLPLLKETIEALINVGEGLDKVFVINNASTDNTHEFLSKLTKENALIEEYLMEENLGGSGGFYMGIKHAYDKGYDYIWIMDDDSIVTPDSLLPLKTAFKEVENVGFCCSKVVWTDGDAHKMNIPEVSRMNDNKISFFADPGYVNVNSCSFVSVLIHRDIVKEVGYPYKDFFIWFDDVEYTKRIIKKGYKGLFSEKSIVIHKTLTNYAVDLYNCEKKDFWKMKYGIRNRTFMLKKHKDYAMLLLYTLRSFYRALTRKNNKLEAFSIAVVQVFKGLRFNPKNES
ncbi:glycosyltransferase family 2 protein [Winogradskyella psychrotolerans]|uniref:glycosyltransferase family 2 protein n=1 Tax=Winogradskyella psychrotolerans TaxID=1344585 RepID=UPI001C073B7D|nr:glycosyltransferase family 2 protein [Winogradskyella psychrotolerans]MBU2921647.1 glycosyltransferase family 2 protein [Winogradskyella psychrotolerans]